MAKDSNNGGDVGLSTLLFVVFLVLKLCHVIDWSWWWVTSPIWIPVILIIWLQIFSESLLGAILSAIVLIIVACAIFS